MTTQCYVPGNSTQQTPPPDPVFRRFWRRVALTSFRRETHPSPVRQGMPCAGVDFDTMTAFDAQAWAGEQRFIERKQRELGHM